jgi:hypothetical protein
MAQASNSLSQSTLDTFRPISARAVYFLARLAAKRAVVAQLRDEGRRVTLIPPSEIAAKAQAYLAEHRGELYGEAIATAWKMAARDQRMSKWLFDDDRRRPVLVTPDRPKSISS